jgi:predicted nucleotide-binding protein (sugar kinase/HSP70/actin superfamily)
MQKHNGIRASINRGDHLVNIELNILIFEEESIHYVYSPALDLTGYGNSEKEAMQSFNTMLEEFVHYTENKKTVYKELERLGWTINTKKKRVHPPLEEQLLEDNEVYRDLKSQPNVYSSSTNVGLALA